MVEPSLSVIIPARNAAAFLDATLASVTAQTYTPLEILVVDDASTDGTGEIAERWAAADHRIKVLSHAHPLGVAEARNVGIEVSSHRWVALCDADDLWAPDKIERQLAFLAEHKAHAPEPVVAVGTWGYRINAAGHIVDRALPADLDTVQDFLAKRRQGAVITTGCSSVVLDREAWETAGRFQAGMAQAEDLDLWTRMAELGLILNVPAYLSYYRLHGASATDQGFVTQRINIDRIRHNVQCRRAGLPEVSLEEYVALRRAEDDRAFAALLRQWRAQARYRSIGVQAVNGRRLGAALAALGLLQHPDVLARGVVGHLRQRRL